MLHGSFSLLPEEISLVTEEDCFLDLLYFFLLAPLESMEPL